MRFLARLFAPSETELLRRQAELERRFETLLGDWTRELLQLTRLKHDLTNQLKSLGAYEARAKGKAHPGSQGEMLEWPDLEAVEPGGSFGEVMRRAHGD